MNGRHEGRADGNASAWITAHLEGGREATRTATAMACVGAAQVLIASEEHRQSGASGEDLMTSRAEPHSRQHPHESHEAFFPFAMREKPSSTSCPKQTGLSAMPSVGSSKRGL